MSNTCAEPRASENEMSPPAVWNVRLYCVPPRPSDDGVHESLGRGDCDGDGLADVAGGVLGEGDGDGDGLGAGDGVGLGATSLSSAADNGLVRFGVAAISTERMPSHDTPAVTAV